MTGGVGLYSDVLVAVGFSPVVRLLTTFAMGRLVGKPVVDFLFVIIELCCCLLWLRHYKQKSVKVGVCRRGWVTFSANFRWKGASCINHCWCRKTRVIVLSCGIKISAVHCLVLSQSTHVMDRQTNRIMTPKTALA